MKAGTDITGFSLMGHALEMAQQSGVGLKIEFSKLPFVSCAQKYAQIGAFPGGAFDNKHYYSGKVSLNTVLDEPSEMLLYDPQTSGGLLMAVPPQWLSRLLADAGIFSAVLGDR